MIWPVGDGTIGTPRSDSIDFFLDASFGLTCAIGQGVQSNGGQLEGAGASRPLCSGVKVHDGGRDSRPDHSSLSVVALIAPVARVTIGARIYSPADVAAQIGDETRKTTCGSTPAALHNWIGSGGLVTTIEPVTSSSSRAVAVETTTRKRSRMAQRQWLTGPERDTMIWLRAARLFV